MKKGLIKTSFEIDVIAEGGRILHNILLDTASLVKPGVATSELNDFAEKKIIKAGGRPSFKGYGPKDNPYPAGLCTSLNDVVVHGMPGTTKLKEGDIISLDVGMQYHGLFTDTAITVAVGSITKEAQKLIKIAKQCLDEAIKHAKTGHKIGAISQAIQETAEKAGFSVVRDLVGHGVGYAVHEPPEVPCYGNKNQGIMLEEGMVLAIEPMVCMGEHYLIFEDDGWTVKTKDGSLAAHFEHTIAITKNGAKILT